MLLAHQRFVQLNPAEVLRVEEDENEVEWIADDGRCPACIEDQDQDQDNLVFADREQISPSLPHPDLSWASEAIVTDEETLGNPDAAVQRDIDVLPTAPRTVTDQDRRIGVIDSALWDELGRATGWWRLHSRTIVETQSAVSGVCNEESTEDTREN